jgi:predicted nuclease of predicted toxin-antitoxin system
MKLLLDQGLPLSASSLLTQQGFDTIHVSEIEMWAAEDIEIIQKAQAENR